MKQRISYLIMGAALVIGLFIWYKYRQPRFIAGETAPDFQVTLPDGSMALILPTEAQENARVAAYLEDLEGCSASSSGTSETGTTQSAESSGNRGSGNGPRVKGTAALDS